MSKTLHISQSQNSSFPKNLSHTTITVPSQSSFNWGSQSIIDFKVKGVKVHELILAINTNAVSGVSADGTYPYLNPAFFWFQKCELLLNNVIIDTLYPDFNFALNQLYYQDEDRLSNSYSAGHYLSKSHLYGLSNTNSSNWYVNLKCFFNQNHLALLSIGHELQLRIQMAPLANIINVGTLIGTPSVSINSVQLLARVTVLPTNLNQQLLLEMNKQSKANLFLSTRYMPITIQAGVTNSTVVMTGITGSIHSIYFMIRDTDKMTGINQFSYKPIKDFQILSSSGENIVGGTVIPSSFNLLQQMKWWTSSTFSVESYTGVNNSNIYMYSFSIDPKSSLVNSMHFSSRHFQGNEQLLINFPNSLTNTAQIDIFALVESAIAQSPNSVTLVTL